MTVCVFVYSLATCGEGLMLSHTSALVSTKTSGQRVSMFAATGT